MAEKIFFKILPLVSKTLTSKSFPLIVETPMKLLLLYGAKLHHHISFNILYILRLFILEVNFHLRKQEKAILNSTLHTHQYLMSMEGVALAQYHVSPKTLIKTSQDC